MPVTPPTSWRRTSLPASDERRGKLPPRCDRSWFAQTFCAGRLAASEEEVWTSVESVNLYSPVALLAALPRSLANYFVVTPTHVRSATHSIIGLTSASPSVQQPHELRSLFVQLRLMELRNRFLVKCRPLKPAMA